MDNNEKLLEELQKVIKYLRTAQFSHGHFEDGNWAANEAAQLIEDVLEDAIKASPNSSEDTN